MIDLRNQNMKENKRKELEKKIPLYLLQTNPRWAMLYILFVKILTPYCDYMGVNSDRVLFHVTRSWYDHREPDTDRKCRFK